ncbi:MAG: alpha/beta hydrolase fold protein [Blastococcus sp.]|jgi:hypothetical protein|nr:alpha/beta hydrolase fold protein [Blastococcus sp.]
MQTRRAVQPTRLGERLGDRGVELGPALTEVTVPGSHFVPEDSPHEIGRALADWIPTVR